MPHHFPLDEALKYPRHQLLGGCNATERIKLTTSQDTLKNDGTFDGTFEIHFHRTKHP
jgi:hypothetical protein